MTRSREATEKQAIQHEADRRMALRDQFATAALQGMLTGLCAHGVGWSGVGDLGKADARIPVAAYAWADAMLEARDPARQELHLEESERVAGRLRLDIESLFGASREVMEHERAAYVEWGEGENRRSTMFVSLAAGHVKPPNGTVKVWDDLTVQADKTLEWFKATYPNAKDKRLLWRVPPKVDFAGTSKAHLYMRIGVVPLDVNKFHRRASP